MSKDVINITKSFHKEGEAKAKAWALEAAVDLGWTLRKSSTLKKMQLSNF